MDSADTADRPTAETTASRRSFPLRILVALPLVLSIWGGMHYYAWARLARDTGLGAVAQLAFAGLLTVLAASLFLSMFRVLPRRLAAPVWTTSFFWAGFLFLLDALLFGSDVATWVARAAGVTTPPLELARLTHGAALVVAVALGALAWTRANGAVPVKPVEVTLAKWPKALDGFRIVQLTDVHVSPDTDVSRIRSMVERANAEHPDLVVLTGDFIDGTPAQLEGGVRPLGDLRAKHGVYFVTGNHEYISGVADAWVEHFRALGIRPLMNERVSIGEGAASFELAGVPDAMGRMLGGRHAPRITETLSGRDPSREVVLLAHQPRQFTEAAANDVGLQLSGHTHGGQIWPFTWLIHLGERRVAGLFREGRSQLYVSRGTGYWGPPMRLGAPQEITRVTVRAAS